jgi:hypothetical protein
MLGKLMLYRLWLIITHNCKLMSNMMITKYSQIVWSPYDYGFETLKKKTCAKKTCIKTHENLQDKAL